MAWVLGDSSLEALAVANCAGRAAPGSMPGSTAAAPCTGNTGCMSALLLPTAAALKVGLSRPGFCKQVCKSRSEHAQHPDSGAV